jgi:hypothetical protein
MTNRFSFHLPLVELGKEFLASGFIQSRDLERRGVFLHTYGGEKATVDSCPLSFLFTSSLINSTI